MSEVTDDSHLIVGVGASAGGLEAFRELLRALPSDSGMTFLLVQHLDPNHASLLGDLLAPHTEMDFIEAEQGLRLKKNTVYVIKPNTALAVTKGRLEITAPTIERGIRLPIDHLFRSLAREFGNRAVGIILSGAGSDGCDGLRDIKARGGLTVAQDPLACQQSGMPQSAIDTGYIDLVLPIKAIPAALRRFSTLPGSERMELVQTEKDGQADGEKPQLIELTDQLADRLQSLLEQSTGFDIGNYKPATIGRRVSRRMVLRSVPRVESYIEQLQGDKDEQQALIRDLLISVTEFYRDPAAFEELEKLVIEPAVRESTSGFLRCWVAGCATGEEAYSLGMSILDVLDKHERRFQLQIFATDIDEDALAIARRGIYPPAIDKQVSPERLARYFVRLAENNYQVRSRLRDTISFAVHDLTKDPPFSKMDVVSCRNVLIYLRPEAQQNLLKSFNFALETNGHLFLGSSESIGSKARSFVSVSKRSRIYRKTATTGLARLPGPRRNHLSLLNDQRVSSPAAKENGEGASMIVRSLLRARLSPTIIVTESGEIVFMHGELRPYLKFPAGNDLRLDFSRLVTEDLATRTRAAVYKCRRSGENVVAIASTDACGAKIRILVSPAFEIEDGAVIVSFDDEPIDSTSAPRQDSASDSTPGVIDELERELHATREDLRNTVEELESANEELRSTNEESMSMNEELQSSNEELEATAEELRSLNEELSTVNAQLKEKIEQVQQAHDDLSNFFSSTKIATIFLDDRLCIKRMTPSAQRLLSVGHEEIGRRVDNVARELLQNELAEEAGVVLHDLTPITREIETSNGAVTRRDIQPYRTESRRIDGVVVTLIDVTALKKADDIKRRLAAIVESSDDAIISKRLDGTIESWNSGAERLFGYSADEMIGRSISRLEPEHRRGEMAEILEKLRAHQHIDHFETERLTKDGRIIAVSITISPIIDSNGRILGASKVARDITAKKQVESALRVSERRYRALVDTQTEMLCRYRTDGTILFVNDAYARAQGKRVEELVGDSFWKFIPRNERPHVREMLKRITPGSPILRVENQLQTANGVLWMLWTNRGLEFDPDGRVIEAQATGIDITDRKLMEEKLRKSDERKDRFLATLSHELRNPLAPLRTGLDLLKHKGSDGGFDDIRAMLDRQVQHLTRLVDDLIDVARINRGQIDLRRSRLSCQQLAQAAIELARPLIDAHEHVLVFEADEETLWVDGDFDRLIQVIGNVLNNAASYTKNRGKITLSVTKDGDSACISIDDNGQGFNPELSEDLFDIYARKPRLRYQTETGLGIGLPLARQLAELHGGTLTAQSDGLGKGSKFSLRLPLLQGDSELPEEHDEQLSPVLSKAIKSTCRIMIVDDNVDAANSLRMLLQAENHSVIAVHGGEAALDAFSDFQPDAILLDIGLPDIDGHVVAEKIRKLPDGENVLLIAITGWGQDRDKSRAKQAGFDAHLTKPVHAEDLLAQIDRLERRSVP